LELEAGAWRLHFMTAVNRHVTRLFETRKARREAGKVNLPTTWQQGRPPTATQTTTLAPFHLQNYLITPTHTHAAASIAIFLRVVANTYLCWPTRSPVLDLIFCPFHPSPLSPSLPLHLFSQPSPQPSSQWRPVERARS